MTVLWVSISRNDVEFPFIPTCRQKSAGRGYLEVENFPRRVQPVLYTSCSLSLREHCCPGTERIAHYMFLVFSCSLVNLTQWQPLEPLCLKSTSSLRLGASASNVGPSEEADE